VEEMMVCKKCKIDHLPCLKCKPASVVDQGVADEKYNALQEHRKKNREALLNALRHPNAITLALRLSLKQRAVKYKGGKCATCGYSKCLRALEFHHLERQSKNFNISAFITGKVTELFHIGGVVTDTAVERIWAQIENELKKCVLLCANCHREVESGDRALENNGT
jgi:hypothetical protein